MNNGSERYVYISCFDEPDRLLEVDRALLSSFDCRLSALVRNTAPSSDKQGRDFFRAGSGMTRAMLVTMIKSMTIGELIISKGVTVGEALKVLEFEGVGLSGGGFPIQSPSSGLAFSKRAVSVTDSVRFVCERVADAIVSWPRLEWCMENVLAEGQPFMLAPTPTTATATRAWVRFGEQPKWTDQEGKDFALALVTKNPLWLSEGIVAVGVFHHRMSQADPAFEKSRDEASFKTLWKAIESDPLGAFFSVKSDVCKSSANRRLKKELHGGEEFYTEVRNAVLRSQEYASTQQQYARAIVTMVENIKVMSPNCGRIFSGACADDLGATFERTALKKALKARNVTVVRWNDARDSHIRPIVFPPGWRDSAQGQAGPCVLLGFENLL